MKELFKKYWWILLLLLLAIAIWIYFYFSNPKNKISFGFNSDNDLAGLLPAIEGRYANAETQRGIGVYLDVPLTAIIKNKSATEITLNNIGGVLSFEGENILQTKGNSVAFQNVVVEGRAQKPVTDTFQVLVNGKTIKYIKEIIKGNKPALNYNITAMVAGDIYSFRDATILNENTPQEKGS